MEIIAQDELNAGQKARVVELWNAEYPSDLAYRETAEFDEYLNNLGQKKHFLLVDEARNIVGWALIFERDAAKWFAIIIDEKIQGKGFGIKLIDALKAAENRLFGWVIDNDDSRKMNGAQYKSPLGFYTKIGFKIHDGEKILKHNISGVKIEWRAQNI